MQDLAYRYVADFSEAAAFVAALGRESSLALDLEADSLHSYREKVCLVQVTGSSGNTILDPLACREALAGLGPLLADAAVRKVLHGADYDVRLLKKDFGFRIANLFDTMIAAQFTGREQFGLSALLTEFFGVTLDKKHQRADWAARPLSPELLSYAALDTAYLFPLRERLEAELKDLGRLHWAQEEFDLVAAAEPGPPKKPWCLDVKGTGRLAPRELAVLQALLEFRDGVAQERDRPPFKVLGNDVLLRWAQSPPQDPAEVLSTPGAPRSVLERLTPRILGAVRAAQALPLDQCPRHPASRYTAMTGAQERRLKRLKSVRQEASERLKLPPGLLVNSATLERLARTEPAEATASLPSVLKRWQMEVLGDALGHALHRGQES